MHRRQAVAVVRIQDADQLKSQGLQPKLEEMKLAVLFLFIFLFLV
jgi:hypothetical protein